MMNMVRFIPSIILILVAITASANGQDSARVSLTSKFSSAAAPADNASSAIRGKARVKLWAWENLGEFRGDFTLNYGRTETVSLLPTIEGINKKLAPAPNNIDAFQSSTEYRKDYADRLLRSVNRQYQENQLLVPIPALISDIGGLLEKTPWFKPKKKTLNFNDLYLNAGDLLILEIIWEQPDRRPEELYMEFTRRRRNYAGAPNMTYSIFARRIDYLKNSGVITSRKIKPSTFAKSEYRFSAVFSKMVVKNGIRDAFSRVDILSKPLQYKRLSGMYKFFISD